MKTPEVKLLLQAPRHAAVAALGEGNISRIIPVAWPMLKSEWDVIVSVSESIGLVDRFVLRALRDFGPCTVKELDELLCLGRDRTEAAIGEMIRVGAPITKSGSQYYVQERLEIDSFRTEHEHTFLFLINGLTGDILPSSFVVRAKRTVLSEEDLVNMPMIVRINPVLTGAESPVLKEMDSSKAIRASEAEGIPLGFKEFSSNFPRREIVQFVLGFLFIDISGNGLLLAATEEADEISLPRRYLYEAPQLKDFLVPVSDATLQELNSEGISFERAISGANILSVNIPNWSSQERIGDGDRPDFAHFVAQRLARPGWIWDRFSGPTQYSHFELRPADEKMARAILTEKMVNALFSVANDLPNRGSFDGWLAESLDGLGTQFSIYKNTTFADELIEILKNRKESALRALANRILGESRGREDDAFSSSANRSVSRTFYDSTDENFGRTIVDVIRNAKRSVCVVSPVIQEDEVFEALREAVSRNVDVQVVTRLGNDRKASSEFAEYDIPRRRLAELGACVRDWDVTVHAKMVLADNRRFLFMTANLNENSLGKGDHNAVEAAFLFEDGPEVVAGRKLFNAIWEGCPTRQEKRDDTICISRAASKVKSPAAVDCSIRTGSTEFLLSTPTNILLSRRLSILLDSAKQKAVFLAMSIYDLEKIPRLFNAFLRALDRKVDVQVLVRPGTEQNFKPSDWPDPSTKKLMGRGLRIIEVPHLHAKGVFIDEAVGLMMSANLNPYSLGDLETSHVEIAVQAPLSSQWMGSFYRFSRSLLQAEHVATSQYGGI